MIPTNDNVMFDRQCQPLSNLLDVLSSEKKFDQLRSYSDLKVDDDCRLIDGGATFTKRGFASLCRLTSMPTAMVDWLARHDYKRDLAKFINSELLRLEFEDDQANRPRKRIFTRFRGDQVRALFSDRYAALDANVLVAMVADALTVPEREHARVHRLSYDGDELALNLFWPGCDREVGGGAFRVGLAIQTSEIGTLRMQVSPWIGRLVCANGLVVDSPVGDVISKRHIGRIHKEQLATSIRQVVGGALAHADRALAQFESSRNVGVADAERTIIQLGRDLRLTTEQTKRWMRGHDRTLAEPGVDGCTGFSLVNGLTASAQAPEVEVAERAHLESLAGRLLAPSIESSLSQIEAEWRRIEARASTLSGEVVEEFRRGR